MKKRGLVALIETSKKNKDGNHKTLQGLKSVTVHERCRKVYSKKRSIIDDGKDTSAGSSRRSIEPILISRRTV